MFCRVYEIGEDMISNLCFMEEKKYCFGLYEDMISNLCFLEKKNIVWDCIWISRTCEKEKKNRNKKKLAFDPRTRADVFLFLIFNNVYVLVINS